MKIKTKQIAIALAAVALIVGGGLTLTSCTESQAASDAQFSPQQLADSLNIVLKSDRKVYARDIVTRLKAEGVITPHEEWQANKTLLLPAQMFRRGAEEVDKVPEKPVEFSYSLQSLWPLNYENAMKQTPVVKEGLQHSVDTGGDTFYGEEMIGDQNYFIAIYPDKAVAAACWECHNDHENRKAEYPEFAQGDVMGGVVIRIPVE
ncbi:MAG: DUF3365 domain-containing protein [Verrucomicrobiota bacterium]